MKLSVLLLCVLHLAFVSGRLLTGNDLPSGSGNFTKISRRADLDMIVKALASQGQLVGWQETVLAELRDAITSLATRVEDLFTHVEQLGTRGTLPSDCCAVTVEVSGKSLPDTAKDECPSMGFTLTEKQMSTFALGNFPSRYRTLFARREQYEQQKLLMMRPKRVPVLSEDPPTKAPPKPASATCSQLGQSCLPHQGCCVPCSTCHCHFFKAICFCRRINTQCTKNT